MRRGKKPTRKQKIRLGQAGLAPENWLVVKQKANGELIILNKYHDTIRVTRHWPDELCRKEQQHEGATAHLPTVWASIRRAAALSRADNQTDICPRCGMMEALAAMPRRETPQERTRRAVYATGNRWAIENFEATHH